MILAGRAAFVILLASLPLIVMACSEKKPLEVAAKANRARIIFKGKLLRNVSDSQAVFRVLKTFHDDLRTLSRHQNLVTVSGIPPCGLRALHPAKRYMVFAKGANTTSAGATLLLAAGLPVQFNRKVAKIVRNSVCKDCVKPRASGLLPVTWVRDGHRLNLRCTVSGTPRPKVKWYKDGREIINDRGIEGKTIITIKKKFTVLNITSFSTRDTGKYECRVRNSKGQDSNSTTVKILPEESTTTEAWISQGPPCDQGLCLNGGTCYYYHSLGEMSCQCAEGYKGYRCENKNVQTPGSWPVLVGNQQESVLLLKVVIGLVVFLDLCLLPFLVYASCRICQKPKKKTKENYYLDRSQSPSPNAMSNGFATFPSQDSRHSLDSTQPSNQRRRSNNNNNNNITNNNLRESIV